MGVKSLGNSVVSGATGIVTKPIEGAANQGVSGFFTGLIKGVAGAVSKPISGTLDLVGSTTEGLKNTQKS